MAFGLIMRLQVGELTIELAPLNKEVMEQFITPGIQLASVSKYLNARAKVLEDEYEWFEKIRTDETSIVWGIWLINGNDRTLIGDTNLHQVKQERFYGAWSGSLIFRREYWGMGIASAIHRARTWYAFQVLGIDRIESEVVQGNVASRRALEKSGYYVTHVQRNKHFVDGELRHMDQLECINPDAAVWKRWWGNDRPAKAAVQARSRANDTMKWAQQNVMLL